MIEMSFIFKSLIVSFKLITITCEKYNGKMTFAEFRLDSVDLLADCKRNYVTGDFSCLEG